MLYFPSPLTLLKQIWDVCVVVSILMFDYDKKNLVKDI